MEFLLFSVCSQTRVELIYVYFLIDFTLRTALHMLIVALRNSRRIFGEFFFCFYGQHIPLIHDENMNENNKTENLIYAYISLTADDFDDDNKIYCLRCKNKL